MLEGAGELSINVCSSMEVDDMSRHRVAVISCLWSCYTVEAVAEQPRHGCGFVILPLSPPLLCVQYLFVSPSSSNLRLR